jgi:hypothetical protein
MALVSPCSGSEFVFTSLRAVNLSSENFGSAIFLSHFLLTTNFAVAQADAPHNPHSAHLFSFSPPTPLRL